MQSKLQILFVILAFLALSGDLRAFENRRFFSGNGLETWEMLDRIGKAEEMIILGKYADAKILADSLAGKYPDSEDVKKLQQCVESYLKKGAGEEVFVTSVKGPSPEDLWAEYQTADRDRNLEKARRVLLKIKYIYENLSDKPAFFAEVAARLKQTESEIIDMLSEEKESIEDALSAAKDITDHKSKIEMCLDASVEALAILEKYDGLEPFVMIKGRIDDCLEDGIRIAYGRAKVLADFDGCAAAIPQYMEIVGRPEFRNYTVYMEAENDYKKCAK